MGTTAFEQEHSQEQNTARVRSRLNTVYVRDRAPSAAAIYCRISHGPSGERLWVRRQQADCEEESVRRGWVVAEVYVDDDISAYNPRKTRPDYQWLLKDIAEGVRDGVMVWRLDRLHRQPQELEEFIVLCDKYRVGLATVTGDVGPEFAIECERLARLGQASYGLSVQIALIETVLTDTTGVLP